MHGFKSKSAVIARRPTALLNRRHELMLYPGITYGA